MNLGDMLNKMVKMGYEEGGFDFFEGLIMEGFKHAKEYDNYIPLLRMFEDVRGVIKEEDYTKYNALLKVTANEVVKKLTLKVKDDENE